MLLFDFVRCARGELEGDCEVTEFEGELNAFEAVRLPSFEATTSQSLGNKDEIAAFASIFAFKTALALSLRLTVTGS